MTAATPDAATTGAFAAGEKRGHALTMAVCLAALPYVGLKVAWVLGYPWGQRDPGLFAAPPYPQANVVTLVLDGMVVALVWALGRPRVDRWPRLVVLVPMWLGGGLLLPVVVGAPVILPAAVADGVGRGSDPLQGWVYAVVYASLIGQAIVMHLALLGYLRRWTSWVWSPEPSALTAGQPTARVGQLPAICLAGAGVVAAVIAGLGTLFTAVSPATGLRDGWVLLTTALLHCLICLIAAWSVGTLVCSAKRSKVLPGLAWFTTAAMLTWGAYDVAWQIWAGAAVGALALLVLRPVAAVLLAAASVLQVLAWSRATTRARHLHAAASTVG